MKAWHAVVGLGLAVGIGAAVFFGTRKAAAADAGAKAFRVDPGCKKVETLDLDAAKAAVQAAVMAELRSKDEKAIDFLERTIKLVIGCTPTDETMFVGLPGSAGGLSWGSLRTMVGDRTVAELAQLAAEGGLQMAVQPGREGAPVSVIADLARWLMPPGWAQTLQRLATVVPIPVPASKYPQAQVPASGWSRLYEWGQGLYVVRRNEDGFTVTVYNLAYYPERLDLWDVGQTTYRGSAESDYDDPNKPGFRPITESDALYFSFLEWDAETGSMTG